MIECIMTGIGRHVLPFDPASRGADVDDAPAVGQLVGAQPVVHGEVAVRLGAHVRHQLRQIEAVVLQSGSVGKTRGAEEPQNYTIYFMRVLRVRFCGIAQDQGTI